MGFVSADVRPPADANERRPRAGLERARDDKLGARVGTPPPVRVTPFLRPEPAGRPAADEHAADGREQGGEAHERRLPHEATSFPVSGGASRQRGVEPPNRSCVSHSAAIEAPKIGALLPGNKRVD